MNKVRSCVACDTTGNVCWELPVSIPLA